VKRAATIVVAALFHALRRLGRLGDRASAYARGRPRCELARIGCGGARGPGRSVLDPPTRRRGARPGVSANRVQIRSFWRLRGRTVCRSGRS